MSDGPGAIHDPYAALRSANYRRFLSGFFFSSMGLQMLGAAISWEVYRRTGDALALGYVGLARALPVVLLALPAGHAADVYSRKWVLAFTQLGFAICAGLIAVASANEWPLWTLYVLLALSGCTRAFNGPTRSAILPSLVPKDIFQNAVTWNSGVFHTSAALGPVIAGVIVARAGHEWPVYVCTAAGTMIFAASCALLKPGASTGVKKGMSLSAMLGGMDYVWREKTVFGAIAIDCLGVLLGGATALLPIYAKDILHVGATGYGVLRAAPFIGAVLMALVLAHRPPFKRAGRTFLTAVALWGAATIAFGLSKNYWASLAVLMAMGAIDNISVVIRHVLVQVRTPDHLRGRVGAVNSMFIEVSNELGSFESGAAAKLAGAVWLAAHGGIAAAGGGAAAIEAMKTAAKIAGAVWSVVGGGVGTLVVTASVAAGVPELRKLGTLHEETLPDAEEAEMEEEIEEDEEARTE